MWNSFLTAGLLQIARQFAIAMTAGSGSDAVKQAVVTGLLEKQILTDESKPKSERVGEEGDGEGKVTEPMAFCDLCSVFASFPTCDPCPSGFAFWGNTTHVLYIFCLYTYCTYKFEHIFGL